MSVRVLHAITRLTLGGSSENTIASCVALSRAGYHCTLATSFHESQGPSLDDARRRGCRVVDIPSRPAIGSDDWNGPRSWSSRSTRVRTLTSASAVT